MAKKSKKIICPVSKKYEVTIPKQFLDNKGLKPGSKVLMTSDNERKQIIIEPFRGGR